MAHNKGGPEALIAASEAAQIDDTPSECPYFSKDTKGNNVLSWVRIINDSTTA
jgi:hypothetical protein